MLTGAAWEKKQLFLHFVCKRCGAERVFGIRNDITEYFRGAVKGKWSVKP